MNISAIFRNIALAVATVSISAGTMLPLTIADASAADSKTPPAIKIAPPAPVFDDAARLAELAARRARVAEKIGPKSVLVLFSTEPRVYTNDVDYEYRQENNLYYLTNLKQKNATLVVMPGNSQTPAILFLPRRDPSAETWTGHMYGPEEARKISGITEIWEASEFEPFMRGLRTRQPYRPKSEAMLLTNVSAGSTQPVTPPVAMSAQTTAAANAATPARPVTNQTAANLTTTNASSTAQTTTTTAQPASTQNSTTITGAATPVITGYEQLFAAMTDGEGQLYLLLPREDASREYKQEQMIAAQWARIGTGLNVRNAAPIFAEMRLRKSPSELQLLQHAIDITTEAFGRSMAVAGRSQWEYEVEGEVVYTFKRRNADHWGYPSIVGCGPNATTLHYIESQGRIGKNDLLLMDVGAEYGHYTADVTRTFPVGGKFTPAQADIYNIVYNAQEAAAKVIRPGTMFPEVHKAAVEAVKDGLLKLGLITDRNSNQYRIWFMHGTSHWLGMNVHDVGGREVKLEPGMVFTNEPGVYIREDALDYLPKTPENEQFIAAVRPAFEKYKNIGVRIEDDMLVTQDGVRWMTEALPRSIADIENFMARATRELRTSELERDLRDINNGRAPLAAFSMDSHFDAGQAEESLAHFRSFSFEDFPMGETLRRRYSFVHTAKEYAQESSHAHQHDGD